MKHKTQLYRLFDLDNNLLYVGISLSTLIRLRSHGDYSKWATKISKIEIEYFDSRDAALTAESIAISKEKPFFNIHHNNPSNIQEIIEDKVSLTSPFHELNINKYERLLKIDRNIAKAYLVDCGITDEFLFKRTGSFTNKSDNTLESFIYDWETGVLKVPLIPCLNKHLLEIASIWHNKNSIENNILNRYCLFTALTKTGKFYSKKMHYSRIGGHSQRFILPNNQIRPPGMYQLDWLQQCIVKMETSLKMIEKGHD